MTTVSGFCGGNSRAADRAGLRSRSGARKNGAIITLVQRSEWSPFGRGARLKKREDRNARVGLRGVGEHSEGGTPSAAPLTTRCECRTLFPSRPSFGRSNLHWRQFALASGGSSLSLADALRRRPRRHHRPHRSIARDVAGLTKRSSMARSVGSALLLLYGFPLRRSLLLRSGFRLRFSLRCFLRHTALLAKLSWRCRISAYANRGHCISITTARRKKQLPD